MPTKPKSKNQMPPLVLEGAAFKRQTFTREHAAALLCVSMDTVDEAVKAEELKTVRRGKRGVGITGGAILDYQARK
jgi:hypothetical protein